MNVINSYKHITILSPTSINKLIILDILDIVLKRLGSSETSAGDVHASLQATSWGSYF